MGYHYRVSGVQANNRLSGSSPGHRIAGPSGARTYNRVALMSAVHFGGIRFCGMAEDWSKWVAVLTVMLEGLAVWKQRSLLNHGAPVYMQ